MRSGPAREPKTGRVYFPKENGGWWVGPKDDGLLASLRLDPFCDTTSTHFTSNLTVEDSKMDLCMILGPKVGVLVSFVAKS